MPFIGPWQPARLPQLSPNPSGTYPVATVTVDDRGLVTAASSGYAPSAIYYDFSVVYTAPAGTNTIDLGDLSAGEVHFPGETGVRYAIALALGATNYDLGAL